MSPKTSNTELSPKQQEVLNQIRAFIKINGFPPTIQQLCQVCGVSSTSTIHFHLTTLKKKGMIHWDPASKRAIQILSQPDSANSEEASDDENDLDKPGMLPLMGTIAAGSPLQTYGDAIETINLSEDLCPRGCYALKVKGVSMIEDHVLDGDIVIINPHIPVTDGDMVVALVEGETATLKRIFRESNRVRLQPANAEMAPIYTTDVAVQGKVEAVIRKIRA